MPTNPPEKPDVLSEEFAQDPHKYYKIMRDHYPVLHDIETNAVCA